MKPVGWLLLGISVMLAAGMLLTAVWRGKLPQPQESSVGGTQVETQAAAAEAAYRVVGVWNGRLAVFLPAQEQPERVYEVEVAALPEEEQTRLADGLTVSDREMLARLLEDYLS